MEINKQLFEDVLSGKLKGTFVLRNGNKVKSSELDIDPNANVYYYPIFLNGIWYTFRGELHLMRTNDLDIIDFIPDTNMKENELIIEIPEGQEIDWQESAKQEKIVFKKKDNKPRSWGEYCHNFKGELFYFGNRNSIESVITSDGMSYTAKDYLPSKELAEAFIAMMQIMSLRQAWIGNWNSNQLGYAIMLDVQRNIMVSHDVYPTALTFPDRNMAVDFMNTFKDLLEIAKPLI